MALEAFLRPYDVKMIIMQIFYFIVQDLDVSARNTSYKTPFFPSLAIDNADDVLFVNGSKYKTKVRHKLNSKC